MFGSLSRLLKDELRGLLSFGENRKLKKADVLLWCHDINRNYSYRGYAYSPIIDTLNDRLIGKGLTTITISRPFSVLDPVHCYANVCTVNGIIARAKAVDFVTRSLAKIISKIPDSSKIYFQVIAWKGILRATNPKVIIGIEPIKELCIAARLLDIGVVDVQHGIQMDDMGEHAGHFYRLEYRGREQEGWPDLVACWDDDSTVILNRFRSEYTCPFTLGHPWVLRFIRADKSSDELLFDIDSEYKLKSKLPVVLYSLQYSRDDDGNTDSFVPICKELDQFIKNEGKSYTWWLRVHPQLLRDEFRKDVFDKIEELYSEYNNVNWYEVSYAPLPYVLSKTTVHLTRNSSVTKEASYFGIKTGFLDDPSMHERISSLYRYLVDQRKAEVLTGYSHIKEFIEEACMGGGGGYQSDVLETYVRPMDRFIDAVADSDKGGVVEKICSLRKNV